MSLHTTSMRVKQIAIIFSILYTCCSAKAQVNYVRTWDMQKPVTDATAITAATTVTDALMSTQYIDGLGRTVQTVSKGITPLGKDMVTPIKYDIYGREQFKYLPYASPGTDGSYKSTAFTEQENFYSDNNGNSPVKGQGETHYFGETDYEPSPLNRVQKVFAPGNNWMGSRGTASEKSTELQYSTNTDVEGVRICTIEFATGSIPVSTTTYTSGQLYKTITIDEAKHQVIEYKDIEQKVILKKVQLAGSPGIDHSGWLCTYYIYDDLNNLRCVAQPEGVELLVANNWNFQALNNNILDEQCFRYEYDSRNRVIMKKVPGAAPVNMVYDARDRLVMTQDGNMATTPKKWMVTVYDALNRPLKTGLLTDTSSPQTHQTNAALSINYPDISGSNFDLLTQMYYDDYTWLSSSGSPFTSTSMVTSETASDFLAPDNTTFPYPQANNISQTVNTGLVTGKKIRALGSNEYLYYVMFYDNQNRVLQIVNSGSRGTVTSTSQYSFDGKLLINKITQNYTAGAGQQHILVTKNTYSTEGRLISIEKNMDNTGLKTIVSNTYNELGQLNTKLLSPAYNSNTGLSNLVYDYNIRGWLLGLNRSYLSDNSPGTAQFGYELGYDKQTNAAGRNFLSPQYNGNIAGVIWKSTGDAIRRKYDFQYDPVNRFMKGLFEQNNAGSTTAWDNSQVNYTVLMGTDGNDVASAYTSNGNIKKMQQWGLKVTSSSQIDNMQYSYFSNSNKLKAVTETGTGTADNKLGDFTDKNTTSVDYGYDINGNLVTDLNKKIAGATGTDLSLGVVTSGGAIVYNYLNLPQQINLKKDNGTAAKGSVYYFYDAEGTKLQKTTVDLSTPGKTITTSVAYIAPFVYESKTTVPADVKNPNYSNVLQFATQEEGRIRYQPANNTVTPAIPASYPFDYFIKDHLGNVRMVLTDEQPVNYYPAATVEGVYNATTNSMVNYEKQFYNIDNSKITPETNIPSWVTPAETMANTKLYYNNNGNPPSNLSYPAGCTPAQTAGSNNVYKLNATTNKTGLEFMIKVMAGDHIDIFTKSYYLNSTSVTNSNSTALDLLSLMTNLLLTPSNAASVKGISASQLNTVNSSLIPASFFRGSNNEPATTTPKAYINYIFFDEQFKYVSGGASRVGASGSVKDHWYVDAQLQNIAVPKNGYIFVYVSNESNLDVFFDNLQVIHKPGPILEETHYYPFGLTMSGISSKAAGGLENREKFNDGTELENKEFSDGSGLELYSTDFRSYDPQIGRFHQLDPLSEYSESWSSYSFVQNNPILYNDPLGLDTLNATNKKVDGETVYTGPNAEHSVVLEPGKKTNSSSQNSSGASSGSSATYEAQVIPIPIPRPFPPPVIPHTFATWDDWKAMGADINKLFTNAFVSTVVIVNSTLSRLLSEKTLNDLVPGSLKRQKNWDDGYAAKTPEEIDKLAKAGDKVAQTMKKIYEQSKRLLEKQKQKHK